MTEDVVQAGCDAGYIENADSTCAQCAAGTYANIVADPQECTLCALDTYSAIGATECVNCGSGLGTLEVGSDAAEDCIGTVHHHVIRILPCSYNHFYTCVSDLTSFA